MIISLFLSALSRRRRDQDRPRREVPVFGIAVAVVVLANLVATAGMLVSLD